MTLSEFEGKRDSTTIYLHVNYKAHMACYLSVTAKNEQVLKVTFT